MGVFIVPNKILSLSLELISKILKSKSVSIYDIEHGTVGSSYLT